MNTGWKYGIYLPLCGLHVIFSRRTLGHRSGLAEGRSLGVGLFVASGHSAFLHSPELEAGEISILSPTCWIWSFHSVSYHWKVIDQTPSLQIFTLNCARTPVMVPLKADGK
jgi:hypothetical protein